MARPLLSAVVGVLAAFGALYYFGELHSPFVRILAGAGITGIVYLTIMLFILGQKDFYLDLLQEIARAKPVQPIDRALDSP